MRNDQQSYLWLERTELEKVVVRVAASGGRLAHQLFLVLISAEP